MDRWIREEAPSQEGIEKVYEWLIDIVEHGPPDDGIPVPLEEDLYFARIQQHLVVEYLALAYECLVIVRRIGPLS